MSKISEAMSWLAWHFVTHDVHGYSQPNREGDGTTERVSIPDWGTVTIAGGDRDCSSMIKSIIKALGIPTGGFTYTGNELSGLTSTGLFTAYKAGSVTPRDGDILLRDGHTEMVVNNATEQAGFRRSENHSITGRKGDQDGQEATHSALRIGSWTWIIRYTGPDVGPDSIDTLTRKTNEEDTLTDSDIDKIAQRVWAYTIQGTAAQDRLYGMDSIQLPKAQEGIDRLNRTDDPTGRNQNLDTHDHVKWIASLLQDVYARLKAVEEKLGAE